jgi:nucleotide-binding universal stress UspA family protein
MILIGSPVQILGAAACAVIVVGCLIRWKTPISSAVLGQFASSERAEELYQERILVPIGEAFPEIEPVALASRLGHDLGAEIILGQIIVVPMSLPLDAPHPSQDLMARIELANSAFVVTGDAVPVRSRILRARSLAEGILRLAELEEISTIVLGIGSNRWPWSGPLGETATIVMRHALCQVVLVKTPNSSEESEISQDVVSIN